MNPFDREFDSTPMAKISFETVLYKKKTVDFFKKVSNYPNCPNLIFHLITNL